jgi:hypothetical protein
VKGFTWSFGDGRPDELVDADVLAVEHEFAKPGTFGIEVRALFESKVVSTTATEHVCIGGPTFDCRSTPTECCTGACMMATGECG